MSDSFDQIVERAFDFLNHNHGFRPVEKERSTVVYDSPKIYISLFYDDQRSFEVSLGLGQKHDPNPSYTFEEILRSQSVPFSLWPSGYSAKNLVDAQHLLEKMSKIVSGYAITLLEGDNDTWERISAQRRVDCLNYAASTSLANAKRAADIAWAAKDYVKVVKALRSVEPSLSKTDLAKLAYAKQFLK